MLVRLPDRVPDGTIKTAIEQSGDRLVGFERAESLAHRLYGSKREEWSDFRVTSEQSARTLQSHFLTSARRA